MTADQLRRLAASKRAQAASLDGAASRLVTIAAVLRDLLGDVPARSRAVWRGPAAEELEQQATLQNDALNAQAAEVGAAAASFRASADRLRSEAYRLEIEASRIEWAGG